MPTLAEQFIAAKGASLDIGGNAVVNIYRRTVRMDQRVHVTARPPMDVPVQGLRIKLVDGIIRINEQDLREVVVWFDTAPLDFEFSCCPTKKVAELRVWNCWRDSNDVTQAWIGNAGMIADEKDSEVMLLCSTGIADFDPQQLTVGLRF